MSKLVLSPASAGLTLEGVLCVGQVLTLGVEIASTDSATFQAGRSYILTVKRRNFLGAAPYVRQVLTRTGNKTATVALDLRLDRLFADIGSSDYLPVQVSVDESAEGVLGFTASSAALRLGNTARRDGDIAAPPSGHAVTADEVQEMLAEAEPAGTAAETMLSHLDEFAHEDIAANSSHRTTSGNPHETTAEQVGADPEGTAAGAVSAHELSHPAPTTRDTRNHPAQTPADGATVLGAVVPDFSASPTLRWTLSGNITSFGLPVGMVAGVECAIYIDLAGYGMPASPAAGYWVTDWDVSGGRVVIVIHYDGTDYYIQASSPTEVTA